MRLKRSPAFKLLKLTRIAGAIARRAFVDDALFACESAVGNMPDANTIGSRLRKQRQRYGKADHCDNPALGRQRADNRKLDYRLRKCQ